MTTYPHRFHIPLWPLSLQDTLSYARACRCCKCWKSPCMHVSQMNTHVCVTQGLSIGVCVQPALAQLVQGFSMMT